MKVSIVPQPTNVVIEYEGKIIFCDTEKALISLIMNTRRMAKLVDASNKKEDPNKRRFIKIFGESYRNRTFENMEFKEPMEL